MFSIEDSLSVKEINNFMVRARELKEREREGERRGMG
jgi:hypothetical protein